MKDLCRFILISNIMMAFPEKEFNFVVAFKSIKIKQLFTKIEMK